ncbi:hypothetical protein F2Q69_00001923 [Brassica cretica]|uniref:Uncharacterized protein n=1 Tax=Brassica cretica TaxID=69181 RepID=A0A8S9PJ35_BRACR|nr:hypothetical protein F2Q69_00001923 [Brassica cretica]
MAKPPRLRHRISSSPSRLALSSLVSGCKVGAVSDESVERSSLLDQIELEFEGMLRSQSLFLILISMVNQAGSDGVKAESKDAAGRQKIILEDMVA